MQYAKMGKTGLTVSRLGFGCMRLPRTEDGKVDRELSTPMLRRAFELGINYFDTAAAYFGGESEAAIGDALGDVRSEIVISTKNHYFGKDTDAWWANLERSLKCLKTDYIDLYLFHSMMLKQFQECVDVPDGLLPQMMKARDQGMVHHICFSCHDTPENMKTLLDTGIFEMMICQYNLLDRKNEEAMQHAADKDIGVVIMGPVGGGRLGAPSEKAAELLPGDLKSTPALALRFVLSNPAVTAALSGMQKIEEVEENAKVGERTDDLTPEENSRIAEAFEERKKLAGLYCTACGYCMPCPEGVDIPGNFTAMHYEIVYGLHELAQRHYAHLNLPAERCIACGKCAPKCPQKIAIPDRLREVTGKLDPNAGTFVARYSPDRILGVEGTRLSIGFTGKVYNLADKELEIELKMEAGDGATVNPEVIEVGAVKPFKRKRMGFDLELLWSDAGIVHLSTQNDKGELKSRHAVIPILRTDDYILNARRNHPPHEFGIKVRDMANVAWGNKDLLPQHGVACWLSCDDENLYAYVEAEDDKAVFAEEAPEERSPHNRILLFLDGRKENSLHKPAYEPGVLALQFFPVAGDEPTVAVVAREGEPPPVEAVCSAHKEGFRMDVRIPLACFVQDEKGPPEHLGFDIGQISMSEDKSLQIALLWAGNRRNRDNASRFGDALVVPT